jgi:linoleoyl-CoA desaturase
MGRAPVKNNSQLCAAQQAVELVRGGLNFQIEHHLFPKISHIHYPKSAAL